MEKNEKTNEASLQIEVKKQIERELEILFANNYNVPVGVVNAFAGKKSNIPVGWALCDGSIVSRHDVRYRDLFNVIGNNWGGSGDPSFNLPDLRGMFLRGVSYDTGRDPDANSRTSPNPANPGNPGNIGNEVGSIQGHEIGKHNHTASGNITGNITGSNRTYDVSGGDEKFNSDPNFAERNVEVTVNNSVGSETRPVNAYVNYIIKL
jgi:microcystin-dependent protein